MAITWVDGVTPLNSANMTQLQTRDEKGAPSGYVGLDSGSNANVAGVFASGYGGARQVTLSSSVIPSGYAGVAFGSTGDTNLYRAAVNDLRTDGSFMAGTHVQSAGGGANRIMLNADGHIYFGGAADTNLYRVVAGFLKTDGHFQTAQNIYVNLSDATNGGIIFGSAGDTKLYRSAAGTLRSNGPYFAITHDAGRVFFGTADDVSIGRAAAGQVSVTGMLTASGLLSSQNPSANQIILGGSSAPTIFFGSAQDTKLYRSSAGVLTTDGAFSMGNYLQGVGPFWTTDDTGSAYKGILFGSAQDTKLYRSSAGTLSTPGSLNIGGPSTFGGGYFYLNDSFAIDGNTPTLAKAGPLAMSTNSQFSAGGLVDANTANANRTLLGYRPGVGNAPAVTFGSALDTSIWRIGAGQLGVDALQIQGTYTVGVGSCNLAIGSNRGSGNVTNWVEIGAPDSGGSGYRMLRVPN